MPYLPPTYPGKAKGAGREPYPLPTYLPTAYRLPTAPRLKGGQDQGKGNDP
jgi:hypothetical protein